MGVADRVRERLTETVEDWTGLTVRPAEDVRLMELEYGESRAMADSAEDLALMVVDQLPEGPDSPGGITPMRRRDLARKSQVALLRDPLAGAEAEMRSNFAFGRGIPKPQAQDKKLQRIIDRAWNDPINRKKLTGFEAQRHRSNELLTQANLFPTIFESNGKVRIAFRNPDQIRSIIVHEEDDELPLYYASATANREWNYETDQWEADPSAGLEHGREKIVYLKHWRNVDVIERHERRRDGSDTEDGTDDDESDDDVLGKKQRKPPAKKMTPGAVEHFRINRVGRTQWGVPPWARVLRYFSAMNQFTEARVSMAQAAASIIATRTVKGGRKQVMKSAQSVLKQTGDLAAARFRRRTEAVDTAGVNTDPDRSAAPPPAASLWMQNESDSLQPTSLNSGAAAAQQDGQIIRAPIAAQAQFGQHWLGDASSTNMATATTLELPALMAVGAWQETFEEIFRWFVNRAIDAAFHAGELGGYFAMGDDRRPAAELVYEEDQEEMERRSGLDLSYNFEMPYPGRRNLPDVASMVTQVVNSYDPEMSNPALREKLLDFLFRHGLQVEDPARAVTEIMDEAKKAKAEAEAAAQQQGQQGQPGQPPGQDPGQPQGRDPGQQDPNNPNGKPNDQQSQYGEARRSTPPSREMGGGGAVSEGLRDDAAPLMRRLRDDVDREFAELIDDPGAMLRGGAPVKTRMDR